ncbi:MAG: SPFH domain-containing protein [Candidatus Woesearchaeota archaeon]
MSWILVILAILAAIGIGLYLTDLLAYAAIALAAIAAIFIFYKVFIKKLDPYEAALIYRFGRFHRISPSGWAIIIPIIEKLGAVVDLREHSEHIAVQIITREGLKLNITALVYYYVSNVKKVILNVSNYRKSMVNLIESGVRDIAGDFSFTQLVVNVEDISELLQRRIAGSLDAWGLTVTTLEIEQMNPPAQVMEALEQKRVSKENLEAKRFTAEARKIITRALGEATKSFDDRTITYLYVKALENMKSAKMLLPAEFMDVVHTGGGSNQLIGGKKRAGAVGGSGGGSNLAKGMIAGTTFNKALNMITDEVTKDATLSKDEIEDTVDKNVQDEEGAAGYDSMDGDFDGQYEEKDK